MHRAPGPPGTGAPLTRDARAAQPSAYRQSGSVIVTIFPVRGSKIVTVMTASAEIAGAVDFLKIVAGTWPYKDQQATLLLIAVEYILAPHVAHSRRSEPPGRHAAAGCAEAQPSVPGSAP